MTHIHQAFCPDGTYEFISALDATSQARFGVEEVLKQMAVFGLTDPDRSIHDLVAFNVLRRDGGSLSLTTTGLRSIRLIEALNGADLRETFRRLGHLDSNLTAYELVRQGMTREFLKNLNDRPGFGRLYLCSPWINLTTTDLELIARALRRGSGQQPEMLVIMRPVQGTAAVLPPVAQQLRVMGASIFLNPRLHTKLYIREPGTSGGYSMAMIGSENLTRSSYLELGIKITSDVRLISQLVAYFLEITNYSKET